MDERRIDLIERILEKRGGSIRVRDLVLELRKREKSEVTNTGVSIAVHSENERLIELGDRPRFKTSREGGEWGWISFESKSQYAQGSAAKRFEQLLIAANKKVDDELRNRLQKMDWRSFESTFLTAVLEKLGFQDVKITQPTRDGGADARVSYKRGLVEANAIVSAKRWSKGSAVSVDEVRQLRGLQGDEDTAIVITTGRITPDTEKEARPSQNQRVVYLIDGAKLIEICKLHQIGINRHNLTLLSINEEDFSQYGEGGPNPETSGRPSSRSYERFRDEMLDELSDKQIADMTGLKQITIPSYRGIPLRKKSLGDRIRAEPHLRAKALQLVKNARKDKSSKRLRT